MQAMQYEITLPADYDMGVIRTRVATRGSALDGFAGLGLKAYCARERGVDGSPVNQYAPFYLWRAVEGMNAFLWGPGFRGLSADFGRPVVRQWTGLAFEPGDLDRVPVAATRTTTRLPADADPAEAVDQAVSDLAAGDGAHSTALAVDTHRWELMKFTLWHGEAPAEGVRYQVLHLSRPELADLPRGRHW